MQNRKPAYVFITFIIFSIIFIFVFNLKAFKPIASSAQSFFIPFGTSIHSLISFGGNSETTKLKEENLSLSKEIIDQTKLIEDSKALRDQFAVVSPSSKNLLEADVVGSPAFIPGVSLPEYLILNKGANHNIKKGQAVIYKDNLVGKITQVGGSFSKVTLISNQEFSITAQTLSNKSIGIASGQGGGILVLGNVVLAQELKTGDLVVSKGDINEEGIGVAPNLIIGKITSVSKNASDLFQSAKVMPLVDFVHLTKVFVEISN